MADRYKILYEGGEGETEVKKSRFIATTRPVKSEEEAVSFIAEMKKKYWDASHNCSAFTIGRNHELTRCSDDGEPAQTAGRPMLDVLLGEDVHDLCVVVTRYFILAGLVLTGARLFGSCEGRPFKQPDRREVPRIPDGCKDRIYGRWEDPVYPRPGKYNSHGQYLYGPGGI